MNQRSEHIREKLEMNVEAKELDFADVAQIVADSGKRTQGMDKSEIFYEASESLACNTDTELLDDWGPEFVPSQSVDKARIESLEEEIACAYKQLRKAGQSAKEIERYLYLAECEIPEEEENEAENPYSKPKDFPYKSK